MDPFVESLKSAVDIVEVIGEHVRLKRLGSTGRWMGLCPFHQEKTASFNVNQAQQFFKCFGCGVGGDVFKFLMQIDGLTFPEALKLLSERSGIPMPKRSEYGDAESKLRGALQEMHTIAAGVFQSALEGPQGGEARAYLTRRGLSREAVETFELGYSDSSGQALTRLLTQRGFAPDLLDVSGLVRKRQDGSGYFDSFRGRLMFPIHNESGKVIGFGGRALRDDDQPKYLNSPETAIYRKTSVLYNAHRARDGMRKSNRAVLVEGYMDVIGVWSAGVKEVVASCGTSLTNAQVRAIHRHADTVVVNFDPDTAGANAAEQKSQLLLDENLHVKIVTLEDGLDPDEYVKKNGAEQYRERLDHASGYFHWMADRARSRFDMRSAEGRMDAFKFLLPTVQKIGDKLERAAIASDLAQYLNIEPGLVLDQFKRAAAERRPAMAPAPHPSVPTVERILLQAVLAGEEVQSEILPQLRGDLVEGFVTREIFEAMRQIADDGSRVTVSELDGRLAPVAQGLLHDVVFADHMGSETVPLEEARACLRRLESDQHKRQADELRAKIRQAEREGRMGEALDWMGKLQRMERGRSVASDR